MTEIEKVRLMIGTVAEATFSDAQIQAFLDLGGSVYMAAALALKSWAASAVEALTAETIGDYSYRKSAIDNALKLAKNYEDLDASIPVFDWAEMDLMGVEEDVT